MKKQVYNESASVQEGGAVTYKTFSGDPRGHTAALPVLQSDPAASTQKWLSMWINDPQKKLKIRKPDGAVVAFDLTEVAGPSTTTTTAAPTTTTAAPTTTTAAPTTTTTV